MKYGIILSLCFLPLGIMFLIMKLSLLFSSTSNEIKYVKEESKKPHGPYIQYEDEDTEKHDW